MTETLSDALRLIRKYQNDPKEKIGQLFLRVARALEEAETPRRDDLAKMLSAWSFWGELGADFQSELLDCIEHTYGFGGPSRWNGFIKAHGTSSRPQPGGAVAGTHHGSPTTSCRFPDCDCLDDDPRCEVARSLSRPVLCPAEKTDGSQS